MIEKLVDHMHWANAAAIDWIKSESGDVDGFLKLASHILNAERVWICRAMRKESDRDTFKVHGIPDMAALNDANRNGFGTLLRADPQEEVDYKLFNGAPGRASVEDMVLHAFSHGFHHVGQMAAMASRMGKKFPDASYIGFTRRK